MLGVWMRHGCILGWRQAGEEGWVGPAVALGMLYAYNKPSHVHYQSTLGLYQNIPTEDDSNRY